MIWSSSSSVACTVSVSCERPGAQGRAGLGRQPLQRAVRARREPHRHRAGSARQLRRCDAAPLSRRFRVGASCRRGGAGRRRSRCRRAARGPGRRLERGGAAGADLPAPDAAARTRRAAHVAGQHVPAFVQLRGRDHHGARQEVARLGGGEREVAAGAAAGSAPRESTRTSSSAAPGCGAEAQPPGSMRARRPRAGGRGVAWSARSPFFGAAHRAISTRRC